MIPRIFGVVASLLHTGARLFRITYNEINILVYYFLIPLTWTVMVDYCLHLPIFTPVLLVIWAGIVLRNWGRFGKWCDWLFDRSVDFLCYFNRWGGNYVLNSVIICVLIPLVIYAVKLVWFIKTIL